MISVINFETDLPLKPSFSYHPTIIYSKLTTQNQRLIQDMTGTASSANVSPKNPEELALNEQTTTKNTANKTTPRRSIPTPFYPWRGAKSARPPNLKRWMAYDMQIGNCHRVSKKNTGTST